MWLWDRGTLQISGGFWLLTAWFVLANGVDLLAVVLAAAGTHELGHYLALRACGAGISRVRISVFGAVMETAGGRLSYRRELVTVLAGPAANLLCAMAMVVAGGERWSIPVGANLVLCSFNLLPIRPLDGGRTLELLVSWAAGPAAGEWAARCVGGCTALALAAGIVFLMYCSGGSLWLLPAVIGLLGAAAGEIVGNSDFLGA